MDSTVVFWIICVSNVHACLVCFRASSLNQMNNLLSEQLKEATNVNGQLQKDIEKMSAEWQRQKSELENMEAEWREEERVCHNTYLLSE